MYIDETGRKIMHGIVKIEQQRLNEAPKEEEEDTHECDDSTSGPEPCYDSDSSSPIHQTHRNLTLAKVHAEALIAHREEKIRTKGNQ